MKRPTDLAIGSKYQRQLERAESRYDNKLFTQYILPDLYDPERDLHVPHFFAKKGNFSQSSLEELIEEFGDDTDGLQGVSELIVNPLKFADYDPSKAVRGKTSGFTPPRERITNAGWMVFTFEHDGPDASSLEMQLDWFAGKPERCKFHRVHKYLSRYSDYRGYSAVFSGHKSVHIHIVFDTRHLSRDLARGAKGAIKHWDGDVPPDALRELHRRIWFEIAKAITSALEIDIEFDSIMANYTQKRRSPWGMRVILSDESPNVHGHESGDAIRQTVVQEHILSRAIDAKAPPLLSMSAAESVMADQRSSQQQTSRRAVASSSSSILLGELKTYLAESGWGTYPEPAEVVYHEPYNYLFFRNHANDRRPTTCVRGDYRKLIPSGAGAHVDDMFLPNGFTLDETLDVIEQRLGLEPQMQAAGRRSSRPGLLFQKLGFGERATNPDEARDNIGVVLRHFADCKGTVLLQAPEGIGKTYALMQQIQELRHDREAERYQRTTRDQSAGLAPDGPQWSPIPGFICFACSAYDQAYAKRDEFLELDNDHSCAIVLKSFSRLYADAVEQMSATQLTREEVGRRGLSNFIQAIAALQPDVYKRMCELRDEVWVFEGKPRFIKNYTVLFAVHSHIQNWPHSHISKAFLHPEFPDDFDQDEIDRCAREMGLYQVIYDEIGWQDLVSIQPAQLVDMAKQVEECLRTNTDERWDDAGLNEQVSAFDTVMKNNPATAFDFDTCNNIIRTRFTDKDKLAVDAVRFPFGKGTLDNNFYAQRDGIEYFCRERRWWHGLGCPVIVLTTEDLPRLIAKSISKSSGSGEKILVADYTFTPHLFNEVVPVWFDERARVPGQNRGAIVELALELFDAGFDFVIGNRLGGIDKKFREQVCSHKAAQGRNDLKDKTIATIVTYPGAEEYDQYAILGAKYDIDDPVAIAYRDMVFQDLGRNLGFRGSMKQKAIPHMLFIKPSLYGDIGFLQGAAFNRYRFYHYEST